MIKFAQLTLAVCLIASSFSCVSNRKYLEAEDARKAAQNAEADARTAYQEAQDNLQETEKKLSKLNIEHKELKADYDLLQTRYNQQQRLNKDLQASYDKLLELNEKLEQDVAREKNDLKGELARKEMELDRKEKEIARREREVMSLEERLKTELANINSLEGNKKDLEASLAEREKRVNELEQAIAARDAKNKALKDKLSQALLGFNSSELTVEERDGKIYVSLSQNLLFSKGSAQLDSKGVSALKKLATVLSKNKDLNILVEGHTDSDGKEQLNWELSTRRSLSIVNELIANQVAPEHITAAGRGEHAPIADNATETGKAKNRRTEIILSPKLDAIFDLLD